MQPPPESAAATAVWIEIGRARLTAAELSSLAPGRVVALGAAAGPRVTIWIGGRPAASGTLGLEEGRPVVRLD
jgi:flagellar motor switch/type III secretory pathway protein FliN